MDFALCMVTLAVGFTLLWLRGRLRSSGGLRSRMAALGLLGLVVVSAFAGGYAMAGSRRMPVENRMVSGVWLTIAVLVGYWWVARASRWTTRVAERYAARALEARRAGPTHAIPPRLLLLALWSSIALCFILGWVALAITRSVLLGVAVGGLSFAAFSVAMLKGYRSSSDESVSDEAP